MSNARRLILAVILVLLEKYKAYADFDRTVR